MKPIFGMSIKKGGTLEFSDCTSNDQKTTMKHQTRYIDTDEDDS